MRKFILILGIFVFLDIFYFAFVNKGQLLTLNYQPIISSFSLNSEYLYAFLGLYGGLGGFLITYFYIIGLKDKLKKATRNAEKSGIEYENCNDKVRVLQSKIDTLEEALKSALKEK